MGPWVWLLVPAAYLLGGVPFGLLIGRQYGIDVLATGSGNIGATNVWRACGPRAGLLVLLLDVTKGLLPARLALVLLPDEPTFHVAAAAAAVLGHTFSPFLRLKGGKGVATSLGAVLALLPVAAGVGLAVWGALVWATRYVSLGSLCGSLAVGITASILPTPTLYRAVVWLAVITIWLRHRANIRRLLRGEELRFGAPRPAAEAEPPREESTA